MTAVMGSSGQEVLQNCTGEFRVYHGTRRGPSTPDLTSQTYLPVVGRKNKPQSAGPYVADVNSSSFKKKQDVLHTEYEGNTAYNFDHSEGARLPRSIPKA